MTGPIAALAARLGGWFGVDLERGGQLEKLVGIVAARAAVEKLDADAFASSLVERDDPRVQAVVDELVVNHSWFFRDREQLATIEARLRDCPASRPARIWVPGCAAGEDVYSIAMIGQRLGRRIDIVGTDVSRRAIERARAGVYDRWSIQEVDDRERALMTTTAHRFVVDPALREHVRFERHNLAEPALAIAGGWDLVLCRNVLIYMTASAATAVVRSLASVLAPDGWLVLGCAELLHGLVDGLELVPVGSRFAFRRFVAPPPVAAVAPISRPHAPPRVDHSAALELALASLQSGDTELVLAICARILERTPASEPAQLYRGVALHMRREWAAAAPVFERLASLGSSPIAWTAACYLALCFERLGHPGDARRALQRASELRQAWGVEPVDEWYVQLAATTRHLSTRE